MNRSPLILRPGLGWQERYLGGSEAAEAAFIEEAMLDIQEVQRRNRKKAGVDAFARAFHAKILAGITNAEFHVQSGIDRDLATGYLVPGASYETGVRFSNASGVIQPDTKNDLRGIALDIATKFGAQHYLATNGKASHARDAKQFIAFALAMSGSKFLILPRLIHNVGLFETVRMFRTVIGQVKRPITSLTTESYFSRSGYAFGDLAARWQISPNSSASANVARGDHWLTEDLAVRLALADVIFDFQVQYFESEETTPIEDGSVEWHTPLTTIAKVYIPKQDLLGDEGRAALELIEKREFNPWTTTVGFRPLGSLNRARRLVYKASQALRNQGRELPRR